MEPFVLHPEADYLLRPDIGVRRQSAIKMDALALHDGMTPLRLITDRRWA